MAWILITFASLLVFVLAAVAVGRVSLQLAQRARRSVYDLDEAVQFVADALPFEVSSQISYDDVRQILLWHVEYLQAKGVADYGSEPAEPERLVVVPDHEPVAYVLGRVSEHGLDVSDEDVLAVLDAETEYYRAIGAIGGPVSGPPEGDGDQSG
ncbi:MAG: hypothetical protein JJLCMIEE_03386 [Acidimicrobiales bacterium]|nr:hypothetical protein [Acidimicrobiales bacterium]